MAFDVKQAIIDRLRATKRKNIEAVIDYMEKHGFFYYHCHRHHHYDGGLADHAWQTYQIAIRLDAERCTNNPNAQMLDEDSLAICTLLHDICDCSGMRYIHGHGIRSAVMLLELGLVLQQEEFLAVRFHMSLQDKTTHPLYDDALKSQLRYIVHKADGISAHLQKGYEDPDAQQEDDEDFAAKFVSALETIGTTENEAEEYNGYLMKDTMKKEFIENTECECKFEVVAVNDELNAQLFEETSGVECNGCNISHLKEFFPNYNYDWYKQYFIKINEVLYDGDTLEEYIWDYIERKNEVDTFGYKVGDKYPLPTTGYLLHLEEDGDPELYKQKYYDATIRYITPIGTPIIELATNPLLITDASFNLISGKEVNKQYPDAKLDDDKMYCIELDDSPISKQK